MKRKWLIVMGALVLCASIAIWATPGSGISSSTLSFGLASDALHTWAGSTAADGSPWHFQLKTEGSPTEIRVAELDIAPGGYSGWHSHTGPVLVLVDAGTGASYSTDCVRTEVHAGMAYFEDVGEVHNLRNESETEHLRLTTVNFRAQGIPGRTEAPSVCGLP